VRKYQNVFKIEIFWEEFKKSPTYKDLISIVDSCFGRADKLYRKSEALLKARQQQQPQIMYDPRLFMEQTNENSDEFKNMSEEYLKWYAKELYKLLNVAKSENYDLIDICYTVVFCMKGCKDK
jgi:hypothetical protein